MTEILGYIAQATIWLGYVGLCHQWFKVWIKKTKPTIPRVMVFVYLLLTGGYAFWGLVISDYVLVWAFSPGLLILPLLHLQFTNSRPSAGRIVVRLVLVAGLATAAVTATFQYREQLLPYQYLIGLLVSSFSLANIVIVLPAQKRMLLAEGGDGSSFFYNVVNLISFLSWLLYGFSKPNYFLVFTQAVGLWLQARVVRVHARL